MTRLPTDLVARLRPSLEGRSCCVTGGCGFIGGHLVDALVSLGARVTVIDDLSNSAAAHIASLMDLDPARVRFVHASILERAALDEAMHGSDLTFHLAALGSVPRSVEDPGRTWLVNATGTMRVLESAARAGVERLVYSASSSAYGDNPTLPKHESQATEPMSPYAAAKLAGESLCRSWSACYGLQTCCLRYFNIFGPRQAADSAYAAVVPAFAKALLSGRAPHHLWRRRADPGLHPCLQRRGRQPAGRHPPRPAGGPDCQHRGRRPHQRQHPGWPARSALRPPRPRV
jgi:nucleoside-diphosphate-sugar epimerase